MNLRVFPEEENPFFRGSPVKRPSSSTTGRRCSSRPPPGPDSLEGNPIHLDMMKRPGCSRSDFMVNLVVNQAGETIGIFTGDPFASHLAAVGFYKVLLSGHPETRARHHRDHPGKASEHQFLSVRKAPDSPGPGHGYGRGSCPLLFLPRRLGTEDMLIPYEGANDMKRSSTD